MRVLHVAMLQIEKEAQTWLDSDSDEEGEKKPEERETRMEEAPPSTESSEPQPGTSKDSEEMEERSPMERSPMEYLRADESEMEELQGAVGGSN